MADIVDPVTRSVMMSRIRGKNTKRELTLRSLLHRQGFRFRLHGRELPGQPDIVFPRHKAVVFVHGCFWHRHDGCRKATMPKSNIQFWESKFLRNVSRDQSSTAQLRNLGWVIGVIWECEAKDPKGVEDRLRALLCLDGNEAA